MNVKKRPRLELTTAATAQATDVALLSNTVYGNVANVVGAGAGNTNSLFLTTTSSSGIGMGMGGVADINNGGAQIYLTICGDPDDDNSSESQEFYAIESIKQEPDLDALHALLPTNLQLPTGCEIYLVKDTKTSEQMLQMKPVTTTTTTAMASIKLEPDSIPSTNVLFVSGGSAAHTPNTHSIVVGPASSKDVSSTCNGHGSNSSLTVATTTLPHPPPATATQLPAAAAAAPSHFNVKLDAYKKRDDKRRATHNEVERRRRDKINCWIFKLKEMLPTEGNRYKPTTTEMMTTTTMTTTSATTTTTTLRSSHNNGRTPPNDSKSQILIKACDYIKSMQNEIDNLRDCLQEAESLRLSNQALRDELENLKQQQELQELRFNTAGGSFNVTLNSLNSSATSDLFDGIDTTPHLSTISSINFTKRGLMITDYDE